MKWIEKYRIYLISLLATAFLGINLYAVVHELYWLLLLPLVLAVFALYFFSPAYVLFLIALLTPFSIGLTFIDGKFGLSVPAEPLLIGLTVLFIFRLIVYADFDKKLIRHPLSIVIILYLFWIFITSINSELPVVSFKFFLSKLWFIIPCYFVLLLVFKKVKNLRLFAAFYMFSLSVVVFYTWIRHFQFGFSEESGHWVMTPFYNDHTAYGAMLAFFIPVLFGYSRFKKYSVTVRVIAVAGLILFISALILSFSRAAWISLIAAGISGLLIVLRIKVKWLALAILVVIAGLYIYQDEIVQRIEKNTNESSENYVEHIRSIYNISSDASNLERINRWQAAVRLFKQRPWMGWGPGTYQFVYAPMQLSREKTIISTNAGDKGNAHSEYLGPLAETGFMGMLLVLAMIAIVVLSGIRVYRRAKEPEIRMLSFSALLALITYFTHGLVNNFLDTDKASVPVWGFMAMIVALEVLYKNQVEET